MSEKETKKVAIQAPQHDEKSSLFSRIRLLAVLSTIALICWGAMEFFTPEKQPYRDQLIGVDPAGSASKSAPIAPRDTPVILAEKQDPPAMSEAATEDAGSDERVALLPPSQPLIAQAPPPPPPAALPPERPHTMQQDRVIGLMDCKISLIQSRSNGAVFQPTLQGCYARLMNANISMADYKILLDMAENGVPGKVALRDEFKQAALLALRTPHKETGIEQNVLDDVAAHLRSLVTVRQKGWQDGDTVEAIAGRAEYYLTNEQFSQARSELQTLPISVQSAFTSFNQSLDEYLAFERMMAALSLAISQMRGQ